MPNRTVSLLLRSFAVLGFAVSLSACGHFGHDRETSDEGVKSEQMEEAESTEEAGTMEESGAMEAGQGAEEAESAEEAEAAEEGEAAGEPLEVHADACPHGGGPCCEQEGPHPCCS